MGRLFATVIALFVIVAACSSAVEAPGEPRFGVDNENPDHGNNRATATPLAAPGSVSGAASSGDPDWFVFDAVTGGTYAINVSRESDGEFAVAVFDEDGEVPGLPVGNGLWAAPTPGEYWIRASQEWAVPFAYTLTVDFFETSPDDHGDSAGEATAVKFVSGAVPAWVAGLLEDWPSDFSDGAQRAATLLGEVWAAKTATLGEPLDEDWFAVNLEKGRRYSIAAVMFFPDRESSFTDPYPTGGFTLYDDGEWIADQYQWGDPPIYFVPTVTGTYHLALSGNDRFSLWTQQHYGVFIRLLEPDDVPDVRSEAVTISDRLQRGTLDARGDIDWFAFDAHEGQTWILEFVSPLDGCVGVHGATEPKPLPEQCGGDSFLWTAPADGTYDIRLSSEASWVGTTGHRYEFTQSLAAPDDHANHARGATVVMPSEDPAGTIDYVGDTDMFRLPVQQGDVWWMPTGQLARGDTYVDAWFVEVGSRVDSAVPKLQCYWVSPPCALSAPRDGAWIIAVRGAEPNSIYRLSLRRLHVSDDYGNDRAHAPDVTTPALPDAACQSEPSMDDCSDTTTVEGTIDYLLDSDYSRIFLPEGNKYEFRLRSDRGHATFTLLGDRHCVSWDAAWGQTHDLWTPETAGDYWIRVGVNSDQLVERADPYPPEGYTLQITARPDDFPDLPTPEEPATQLEPNTVHAVFSGQSSGEDPYRVTLDHPHYIIEIDGAGFWARGAWGASVQEGSRHLTDLWSPTVDYRFTVSGPEAAPYLVVVRERQPSDDEIEWTGPPHAHAHTPNYCYPHDH